MGLLNWMMISLYPRVIPLFIIFLSSTLAFSSDKELFAQNLEQNHDWYRAIGVRKELRFETDNSNSFWKQTQKILEDLWAAKQYQEGLNELARLDSKVETNTHVRSGIYDWSGLFQYKLGRYSSAEYFWGETNNKLYNGLLLIKTGRNEAGLSLWSQIPFNAPDINLGETKTPLLAAGLSLVLPGVGQVYSGHWMDGAQALLFVSTMGLSTYCAYQYDNKVSGNYGLTTVMGVITLFFEVSNVYGAYKTAEYYNENKRLKMMEILEEKVFQLPLPQISF